MVDFPKGIKRLWNLWNIRGILLISLSLQTVLTLFAPLRSRTNRGFPTSLIWSAYFIADWAPVFAVGLISNDSDRTTDSDKAELLAFWTPFLLLHLGGPDTITAFSLEDNELWLRHLIGLFIQIAVALYIFVQTVPGNEVWMPTTFIFLAGIIKYHERTLALLHSSLDNLRDSMIKDQVPASQYYQVYGSEGKVPEILHTPAVVPLQSNEQFKATQADLPPTPLSNHEVVRHAYNFVNVFKGLIVDLIIPSRQFKKSRKFICERAEEDTLRLLEVELHFIYQVLYTKVQIIRSIRGVIYRLISFCAIVAAFASFHFRVNKNNFHKVDAKITYTLLWGAVVQDIISLFKAVFSDWTVASFRGRSANILSRFFDLRKPKWRECETEHFVRRKVLATPVIFRRWSGYVSGYSLIRYCLKARSQRIHKVQSRLQLLISGVTQTCPIREVIKGTKISFYKVFHIFRLEKVINLFINLYRLEDSVDEMLYKSREPLSLELWQFILRELKSKAMQAKDRKIATKMNSARGGWVLQDRAHLLPYVEDVSFEESLLMWHVATDLCYHADLQNQMQQFDYDHLNFSQRNPHCLMQQGWQRCCKILGDIDGR
ncbi:uncharacterized protein LOC119985298 [Tripterygium wilfordii]|uniref:uncharacterized protein LOC119985298 n=1 Tax=Tripterygium wilfordii TaxID=458696 RepID=UPI0018F818AD|nr:uncharacterized protein LOC119985298 [Tripterygium wilfordii]